MNGNYDRPGNPANQHMNSQRNRGSGGMSSMNGSMNGMNSMNNMNGMNNMNSMNGSNNNSGELPNIQEIIERNRTRSEFTTPVQQTFDSEEMAGSMQKILSDNIGEYVVIEFLIGTERMQRKQGILFFVGTSYVTLYDDDNEIFIICDIFSIKFVYFYYPNQRPNRNYNILPNSNGSMG